MAGVPGIRSIEVDRGRPLTEVDNDEARRVVVIGHEASRLLFADRDPVGSRMTLDGLTYTVVGRVRKKTQDSSYTGRDDERLFIPYSTMRQDFPLPAEFNTPDSLSAIIVGALPARRRPIAARSWHGKAVGAFGLSGRTPVEVEIRAILAPLGTASIRTMWRRCRSGTRRSKR